MGGKTKKTKTKNGKLNPNWNETFEFEAFDTDEMVAISLWDKNAIQDDEFIGYTFVSFDDCYKDKETEKVCRIIQL